MLKSGMERSRPDIDRAIGLLQTLTAEQQQLAVELIEDLAKPTASYALSNEELEICEAALTGPLASADEVADLLDKPWRCGAGGGLNFLPALVTT
jgi:hypothetical protein